MSGKLSPERKATLELFEALRDAPVRLLAEQAKVSYYRISRVRRHAPELDSLTLQERRALAKAARKWYDRLGRQIDSLDSR